MRSVLITIVWFIVQAMAQNITVIPTLPRPCVKGCYEIDRAAIRKMLVT
jgi:hypothetical protein